MGNIAMQASGETQSKKYLELYTPSDVHAEVTGGFVKNEQTNGTVTIATDETLSITFKPSSDAMTTLSAKSLLTFDTTDYTRLWFKVSRPKTWTHFHPHIKLGSVQFEIPNTGTTMTEYALDISGVTGQQSLAFFHSLWVPPGTGQISFEWIKLSKHEV